MAFGACWISPFFAIAHRLLASCQDFCKSVVTGRPRLAPSPSLAHQHQNQTTYLPEHLSDHPPDSAPASQPSLATGIPAHSRPSPNFLNTPLPRSSASAKGMPFPADAPGSPLCQPNSGFPLFRIAFLSLPVQVLFIL